MPKRTGEIVSLRERPLGPQELDARIRLAHAAYAKGGKVSEAWGIAAGEFKGWPMRDPLAVERHAAQHRGLRLRGRNKSGPTARKGEKKPRANRRLEDKARDLEEVGLPGMAPTRLQTGRGGYQHADPPPSTLTLGALLDWLELPSSEPVRDLEFKDIGAGSAFKITLDAASLSIIKLRR